MIEKGRHTDDQDGSIVVFVIGMRINRVLSLRKWLPVFAAMPRMLRELERDPDSGYLGGELMLRGLRSPMTLQYWRSFEHLHRYAHDPAREHRPAWTAFNKAVGGDGTVGIFHETYVVPAGAHESIYANMPPFGLGKVAGRVPAIGNRKAARERLHAASADSAASVSAIQPPPSTRSPE